jgi:hypothetical protein
MAQDTPHFQKAEDTKSIHHLTRKLVLMKYCLISLCFVTVLLGSVVLPGLLSLSAQENWNEKRSADRIPELGRPIGERRGHGIFPKRTAYIHKQYSYDLGGTSFIERTLDMFPPDTLSTEYGIHQDFTVFYAVGLKK